jgi:hypothetical protein
MDAVTALHFQKRVFFRGGGFVLAAATLCGALITGSVLRDTPRIAYEDAMAIAEIERKDQARLDSGRQADRHATSPENAGGDADIATSAVAPPSEEREEEFAAIEIVDGRTFKAGAVTIRLADLELPHPEQVCRTLDNRLEQCAARAATQLELLTRSRRVACRYRMITSSEAIGECRIGSGDLAARMIRTGYVQRAAGNGRGPGVGTARN